MQTVLKKHLSEEAFTLIEVMISLLIFVFIVMLTTKSIDEAGKLKYKLSNDTEFASELRTSIGFIERDLNQVFNPRWFLSPDLVPLDPDVQATPTPSNGKTTTPLAPPMTIYDLNKKFNNTAFSTYPYWGRVLDYSGIRASRFKGDETHLTFVTSDHVRVYRQKKESIYAKIKYELIKDTLYKTVNTHAFEIEEKADAPYLTTYVILSKIKKMKFQYYKEGEKDPLREWDSEANDGRERGVFPTSVQMDLELEAPNGAPFATKVLFKLETPNNVLPKTY